MVKRVGNFTMRCPKLAPKGKVKFMSTCNTFSCIFDTELLPFLDGLYWTLGYMNTMDFCGIGGMHKSLLFLMKGVGVSPSFSIKN